jgi:hypothetical protein
MDGEGEALAVADGSGVELAGADGLPVGPPGPPPQATDRTASIIKGESRRRMTESYEWALRRVCGRRLSRFSELRGIRGDIQKWRRRRRGHARQQNAPEGLV